MQNATTVETERGMKSASMQGRAGVELQMALPDARIVYASATGASAVEHLAYAERLGLWRGVNAPFTSRAQFIQQMNKGGVAALEMVSRDLKGMGLYCSRNLSFEGVEYEFLDHDLTPEQVEIYDSYADAFKIIHNNLEAALESSNIVEDGSTKNRNAVAAARSSFESTKQRFFNHLITAAKVPTLLKAIRADQDQGRASVIQIVSTNEALMNRRLAEVSPEDIADGNFDLTPREAVMDYLVNSFPTQLFEIVRDENGNEVAEPVYDKDGAAVHNQDALQRREMLIQHLGMLPAVSGALDQILWTFGTDNVAEITGRTRRIIKHQTLSGEQIRVERRPSSSNTAETDAFMSGKKNILIFSMAGGTGRSYHADLSSNNQNRRSHYLLEAGWKADAAVQGLGRSHRTHQAVPPIFRPVSTNVKGEKRFLSTIARRLDALGALTKGERVTGGQGMFKAEDNLESTEACDALRIFYRRLAHSPQAGITIEQFQDLTGLKLLDQDGTLKEELPPIKRFLNRLLALPIAMQNTLFAVFEEIVQTRIEAARLAGTLDVGAETIIADSIQVDRVDILRTDPVTQAKTKLLHISRRTKTNPCDVDDILDRLADNDSAQLLVNTRSKRAALSRHTTSITDENTGAVHERIELIRPNDRTRVLLSSFEESAWLLATIDDFKLCWQHEVSETPEYYTDQFGLVVGLIMPLWSILASERPTVYKLTDDTGTRHLGRYIPPSMISGLLSTLDVGSNAPRWTTETVLSSIKSGRKFNLNEETTILISKVMDSQRIELRNPPHQWLDTLKAFGCFVEVIQWRTRVFIPNNSSASAIITKILDRFKSMETGVDKT